MVRSYRPKQSAVTPGRADPYPRGGISYGGINAPAEEGGKDHNCALGIFSSFASSFSHPQRAPRRIGDPIDRGVDVNHLPDSAELPRRRNAVASSAQEGLDRAALIHGAVTLRNIRER